MRVLDELREKMHARQVGSMGALDTFTENTRRKAWAQAFGMVDAFEAAHPGLIDKTQGCANCGLPLPNYWEDGSGGPMNNPGWGYIWTFSGPKWIDQNDVDDEELHNIWLCCPTCVGDSR